MQNSHCNDNSIRRLHSVIGKYTLNRYNDSLCGSLRLRTRVRSELMSLSYPTLLSRPIYTQLKEEMLHLD
jgi:hypothetical protein